MPPYFDLFSLEYVVTSSYCNNFIYFVSLLIGLTRLFWENETKKYSMNLLLFAFDKVQICCFQIEESIV